LVANATAGTQQAVPIAQADARYAAINGSASNAFQVAAATAAADAIQMAQTLIGASPFPSGGSVRIPVWTGSGVLTFFIQWAVGSNTGNIGGGGTATQTINWPVAFPTAAAFAITGKTGSPNLLTTTLQGVNTTGATVYVSNPSANTYSTTPIVFGVGY
jgi:hypothetical protein